jgi:cell division protein FtsZ
VKQETLQFESVARGRFEKSEPTIVEGEDLDVPTFLRMRGKTK